MQRRTRFPGMRACLWLWLWLAMVLTSFKSHAAEPDWYVEKGVGWRSRATALETSFLVTVDGQLINPLKAEPPADPFASIADDQEKDMVRSELKGSVNAISVTHETRYDRKRNALRVLDVLRNNDSKEKRVRVEFHASMRPNSNAKFSGLITDRGEVMEKGRALPEGTRGIILLAELPDSLAVPLFVWGDRDARWPVSVRDYASSVRLSYEGVIRAGDKVALVHWIATAGLEKSVKLERTFDLFFKDGKLLDPLLEDEILPFVVNFKPGSLSNEETPDPAPVTTKLVALEKLCEKLGIKRGDQDMLWMNKEEIFQGRVEAEKLTFSAGDLTREMDWKDVAAVRGGGGRGREHRLYLRDGSIWDGRVKFSAAKLTGGIGTLTLDGDALELLLGKHQPDDGRIPGDAPGFLQTLNGMHYWMKDNAAFPAKLISIFGELSVDTSEIYMGQRRMEPPYQQTLALMDGSRINGVLMESVLTADIQGLGQQSLPVSELSRWGTTQALGAENEGGRTASAEPPARYCWLRDGSFLVGTLTDAPLLLRTRQEEVNLKSQEIARIAPMNNDSLQVSVEMLSGAKLKGRLVQDTLSWQLGKQVVLLPVGLVTELVRKEKP